MKSTAKATGGAAPWMIPTTGEGSSQSHESQGTLSQRDERLEREPQKATGMVLMPCVVSVCSRQIKSECLPDHDQANGERPAEGFLGRQQLGVKTKVLPLDGLWLKVNVAGADLLGLDFREILRERDGCSLCVETENGAGCELVVFLLGTKLHQLLVVLPDGLGTVLKGVDLGAAARNLAKLVSGTLLLSDDAVQEGRVTRFGIGFASFRSGGLALADSLCSKTENTTDGTFELRAGLLTLVEDLVDVGHVANKPNLLDLMRAG